MIDIVQHHLGHQRHHQWVDIWKTFSSNLSNQMRPIALRKTKITPTGAIYLAPNLHRL